jgi:hypothetical protein
MAFGDDLKARIGDNLAKWGEQPNLSVAQWTEKAVAAKNVVHLD